MLGYRSLRSVLHFVESIDSLEALILLMKFDGWLILVNASVDGGLPVVSCRRPLCRCVYDRLVASRNVRMI